jgi:hypothetical protein
MKLTCNGAYCALDLLSYPDSSKFLYCDGYFMAIGRQMKLDLRYTPLAKASYAFHLSRYIR